MSRPFRSQKTYDAVLIQARFIRDQGITLDRAASAIIDHLEPQHAKGNDIDEEIRIEDYDRLDRVVADITTEFEELTKLLQKHRMCLEDEEAKAEKCGDCLFLHSPVDKCELYEDNEGPCPYKIVDVKFIDIEDPNAGRMKG